MAKNMPNMERRVVAIGTDCVLRCGSNAAEAANNQVAFVSEASYSEDFQLMDCNVIGYFGPVSIDPQNYQCSITLNGFIPHKRKITEPQYEDGGKVTILDYVPSRQDFVSQDAIFKIPYMDFYDERSNTILASFTGVTFGGAGMSISPGAYVTSNISIRCLYKNKDF
ncbi:MAG: hypothetical protein Ta2A_11960 [Treponemataceae bacterium]|nr:MAG: hypothetical protein Ta2A_11960 [Treponemataceae bacterium]